MIASNAWQRLASIARKEMLHIFRDGQTLFMTLFFPIVELMMLGGQTAKLVVGLEEQGLQVLCLSHRACLLPRSGIGATRLLCPHFTTVYQGIQLLC